MPWKHGYTISDEVGIKDHAIRWPHGRRMAAHIVLNLSLASGPAGISRADLESSQAAFAMNEGLDLLLAALARQSFKATVAVPAVMARALGPRLRAMAAAGHEIAALGVKHEDTSGFPRADEAGVVRLATDVLSDVAGVRPVGWFTLPRQLDRYGVGTVSPATIDLLIDAGYAYFGNGLADDAPHYWVTDFTTRRALLAMPYYYHFDDQHFCMFPTKGTGLENSDMLIRNLRAELGAQWRRGRFFTMVLHPQHAGWCNRLGPIEEFLAEMARMSGLWVATGRDIANHWRTAHPPETHLTLEPSIWKDYPGSLS